MISSEKAARIEYQSYVELSGVSVAPIWAKIRRRKWLIAGSSLVLFGMFATTLLLLPKSYTSEAEVMVEQRPQGVDLGAVLSRMPTDSQAVLTEAEALRSRALVQKTINQLHLAANPEFNPRIIPQDGSLRARWRQAKAGAMALVEPLLAQDHPIAGDPVMSDATEAFLKRLRVMPIGRSQVLRASFTSENPQLSSEVLNALVSAYLDAQMENRVAVPTKVGDFMKGELARLQAKVRDANEEAERYRNQAKLQQGIVQGREALLNTQELSEANSQLISVRIKSQEAQARLSEIRANPNSFADVLASVPIQQVRQQLSVLKESRAQLISTYGRSYPKLQEVEASIADGERRLNAEVAKVVRSTASDVAVLTERESQLAQSVAQLKERIQGAGNARASLASLEQDAEVNRSILSTFLTQYNQLMAQRALQIADSYVLARADIPTQSSFPPLLPFLGLALIVSLMLAVGVALMLERTGATIRNSQEVRPLLTARALGVIPELGSGSALSSQVIDSPQSSFTESIRNVLSCFMVPRNLGRAVLVASAQSQDGRTTLAIALARLAALSGQRAILLDCNLRNPVLHDAFGATAGPGLTELLQHRLELGKVVRHDTLSPLNYITAGTLAPHSANLLCLPDMARLLSKLRAEYDILILDSPPSAAVADARFLAQVSDEYLFVVSSNRTPWKIAREQIEELSHYCDLAGVVLNEVDLRKLLKIRPAPIASVRASAMIEKMA